MPAITTGINTRLTRKWVPTLLASDKDVWRLLASRPTQMGSNTGNHVRALVSANSVGQLNNVPLSSWIVGRPGINPAIGTALVRLILVAESVTSRKWLQSFNPRAAGGLFIDDRSDRHGSDEVDTQKGLKFCWHWHFGPRGAERL